MLFHSLLFITNQQSWQDRLEDFQKTGVHPFKSNSTDTSIIQTETSIGIELAREIKHFLSTKPLVENYKTVIVTQAELMTIEAQNALLKTLEEPNTQAKIILLAPNTKSLLPTIVSRCQILRSDRQQPEPDLTSTINLIAQLKNSTLGDKIALSDSYKDRSEASNLTKDLISFFRQNMFATPNKKNLYNLTLTLYTHKLLGQNVNVKLALDNLFIYLKF